MKINQFLEELKKIGITLDDNQLQQYENYYELLIAENKVTNLTRIVNKEDVYLKHFFDSLTIVKVIDLNQVETICDVGSGAGFPGIALKIAFPHLSLTLIDSTQKKVNFMNKVIKELKLSNSKAICTRIEEHNEKYDLVTARAVAKLNVLLELCIPITKLGKYFISMKANANEEISDAENALKIMNSKIEKIEKFNISDDEITRTLIKIKKERETDSKYPRKFDKINKNPL